MRALKLSAVLLLLCLQMPTYAQQAVSSGPDWVSYGTAAVNPTIAAASAWRSSDRACRFGQLAISEAVGNVAALTLKHFIVSARPCLGCQPDGMPSGHTMNSWIGVSSSRWGFEASVATGSLRMAAHRHTALQVLAGTALGLGAEGAGHLLKCRE